MNSSHLMTLPAMGMSYASCRVPPWFIVALVVFCPSVCPRPLEVVLVRDLTALHDLKQFYCSIQALAEERIQDLM